MTIDLIKLGKIIIAMLIINSPWNTRSKFCDGTQLLGLAQVSIVSMNGVKNCLIVGSKKD